ncbi:right-handed parallel beta-helix repeat-containing protein [Paenibacillus nanensis]|uniref:right-handed parallel beta-helix repeat-containing protein n=1 Tax=Paenibacillus nanensis TaxID=393251 RepID=UPI0013C2BD2D|nr:right-handed parallel beta-helix repeat-containing protein [Paenibacillus nanensis]
MKWIIWTLMIGIQLSILQLPLRLATEAGASLQPEKTAYTESNILPGQGTHTIGKTLPTGADLNRYQLTPHVIDLNKWGIRNDGTDPVRTTKGINEALLWAHKNGITAVTLPAGTYLIDKDSRINMVGNMLFDLPSTAILQKEPNGKEYYHLLYIGPDADHVTIRGGVYKGDRDKHDYSKKDHAGSFGTHESGYGIAIEGADFVTIDGVTSTHFTGDGLLVGGFGTSLHGIYADHFESGTFNDKGIPAADKQKIRTAKPLLLDNKILDKRRVFELSNPINLPEVFDIYFYDHKNKFLKKLAGVKVREEISIPYGAAAFHLVFAKSNAAGAHIQTWSRVLSTNVLVQNSEFAYNRRQGITVGGAEHVLIQKNELHHMQGTAPQSGIDVEGGFHLNGFYNKDIIISDNSFHNNAAYDVILYDGENAVVQNNRMASKGKIGLAISKPFSGALVKNNFFDGSTINVYRDATFINNRLEGTRTSFSGTNIRIDGMKLVDSVLHIDAIEPFGVQASNVTIHSVNKSLEAGLSLTGKRVRLDNITISGESKLRTVTGGIEPGSIINNLKVTDYNSTYGLSLPPAIYNNCEFAGAEGGASGAIGVSNAGAYTFNNCVFTFSSTAFNGLVANNPELNLTIKKSRFELLGHTTAIHVQSAANVLLEDNAIVAHKLKNEQIDIIRLNEIGKANEKNDILKAAIRRNTIATNRPAIGISTINAGVGAPSYTVERNTLVNAKLALKENDAQNGNITVNE